MNDILNEFVSQTRDSVLSDIIQYLRDLQITMEEYFLPVVGYPRLRNNLCSLSQNDYHRNNMRNELTFQQTQV